MTEYRTDLILSRDALTDHTGALFTRGEVEATLPLIMSYRGRRFLVQILDDFYGTRYSLVAEKVDPTEIAKAIAKEIVLEDNRVTSLEDISDELIRYIQAETLRTAAHKIEYDEKYPISTLNNYASDVEDGLWD